MPQKILIADDDENIRDVTSRYLKREGYEVLSAADGEEAMRLWRERRPDLLILDLMMPRKDGWAVCEEIRQAADVPIIMLTALGEERDRVMGLTIGADDYVTKPFSPRELVLRVQIILRRVQQAAPKAEERREEERLTFGHCIMDREKRKVFVDGQAVELTVKEFELLWHLVSHPDRVFSRSQLLNAIWDFDFYGDTTTVTVHVRRLREKIEKDPSKPQFIKTVWGIGYKFEGKSERAEEGDGL